MYVLSHAVASPWLAFGFVLIASLRIVSTYTVFNHTIDEPAHIAAGMEWLDQPQYRYEDQHPPFARMLGAIGPYLIGERAHNDPGMWMEGFLILGKDAHYDRTLSAARAGILPAFWIACLVVFLWTRRIAGPVAGNAAVLLFTTIPPVLAHAGVATTDMTLTAMVGAAAYATLLWAERPTVGRTLLLALTVALAVLAKFSSVPFLPCIWAAMYLWCLIRGRRGLAAVGRDLRTYGFQAAAAACVAFLIIWAGYWFDVGLANFEFRIGSTEYEGIFLPAPALFTGIRSVWEHHQMGHWSYLLGKRSISGFWYYYPVVLSMKTPLALLLLLITALVMAIRGIRVPVGMPLALIAGVLGFAACSRINIGVRHVLPVYVAMAVIGGVVVQRSWAAFGRAGVAMAALLLAWQIGSGAVAHPNYLAYTNAVAGDRPEELLSDSDLDWGQDMKRLGARLKEAGATSVAMMPFNRSYFYAGHPFPKVTPMDPTKPSPGWNAVSESMWKIGRFNVDGETWPDRIPPQERIGKSIFLWYFPEK